MLDGSCHIQPGGADANLPAFVRWLFINGVALAKLELRCFPRRGMFVREGLQFEPGEKLLSVPHDLLITAERAREEPRLSSAAHGTNLMALFLISQANNASSFWHPYAAVLPRNVSTTLVWEPEELLELQASDLVSHTAARASAVERNRRALEPQHDDDDGNRIEPSNWSWALSMIWSRSHTVSWPGKQAHGALAPLIDMFNHAAQPNVDGASSEDGALVIRAKSLLAGGTEVTVPYGSGRMLPNAQLLLDYGFCVEANPHDDVALPLTAPTGDAAEPNREALQRLQLLDTPPPRLRWAEEHGGDDDRRSELPAEAVVYARLATVSPSLAPAEAQMALQDLPGFIRTASKDGEARRFLLSALEARLAEYATSIKEDAKLLAAQRKRKAKAKHADAVKSASAMRKRCAIVLRLAEKRILQSWVDRLNDFKEMADRDEL